MAERAAERKPSAARRPVNGPRTAWLRLDSQTYAAIFCSDVQNAQRRAATGMSERYCGHFFVEGSSDCWLRERSTSALIGLTTRKNTTIAIRRKAMVAVRNKP